MEGFTMQRFTLPRDLYHGKGALEALKSFEGKKAIICVGGGSMKRFGFLDKAEAYLREAGMEVKLFEGIEPDPSVETVMKGAAAMAEFEPDWIVAIGGGSPIDAAKAMWIKYEYPDITFEDMLTVRAMLLHGLRLLRLMMSRIIFTYRILTSVSTGLSSMSTSMTMQVLKITLGINNFKTIKK